MRNIFILRSLFNKECDYSLFLKQVGLDKMISYPIFLYKDYFLSDDVIGLIKNKEIVLYNKIIENIKETEIVEIKID